MNKRPTFNELNKKIRSAKLAAINGDILLINPDSLTADAIELGYMIEQISNILEDILNETRPTHYVGQYPPMRSYEAQIKDKELYAFKLSSKRLGCKIYLKFALLSDSIALVSLHEDRNKQGGQDGEKNNCLPQ